MRKRLRLKKMVSALLAVAMIGQSCLVTTAGDLTDDAAIVAMQEQAAAEEAAARKAAEEKAAQEAAAAQKAAEEKAAQEAAAAQKAAEEKAAQEAAAAQKAAEEKAAQEAAAAQKAAEEKAAQEAAAAQKAAEEAAAQKAAEEAAAQKAAEDAAAQKAAEEAAAAQKAAEEAAAAQKAAEDAAAQKAAEEAAAQEAAAAQKAAEDAAAQKAAEEVAAQKAAEEAAAAQKAAEDAAAQKAAEEKAAQEITYRVTFEAHAADYGSIYVRGESGPIASVSSYYKEVKENGSFAFTIHANDGYEVEHVRYADTNAELPKNAQGAYEIAAVTRNVKVVVTYKIIPQETADAAVETEADEGQTEAPTDEDREAETEVGTENAAEESTEAESEYETEPGTEAESETESENEKEIAMPEFHYNGVCNGIAVAIRAPEGVFPEGTKAVLAAPSAESLAAAAAASGQDASDLMGVDITFRYDGKEIQPTSAVEVSFRAAEIADADISNVYHVSDGGAVQEVAASKSGASLGFTADSFSTWIFPTAGGAVAPASILDPETSIATYVFTADGETVDTQYITSGDTLSEPAAPVKEGHRFIGWYVGETPVTFGTVSTVSETAEIIVEARFEEVYYVFFHNPEGAVVATKEGIAGAKITTSDVTFAVGAEKSITGWYEASDYSGSAVESVTLSDSNRDLYAKVENGFWVTYDSDGGSYVAPEFYPAGETAELSAQPTKNGYSFEGWYDGNARVTNTTMSVSVKAKWKENSSAQYRVIYWQQKVTDDKNATDAQKTYAYVATETKTGKPGTTVNASSITKSYNGFTKNTVNSKSVTIAADGSTIMNVYYDRVLCTVNYHVWKQRGWSGEWNIARAVTGLYGANLKEGEWWTEYYWYTHKNGGNGCILLTSYDFKTAGYANNAGNISSDGVVTTCNFYGTGKETGGTVYYYNEQADGSFKLVNTVTTGGGTLTIHQKYAGYDLYKYTTGKISGKPTTAEFWKDKKSCKDGDSTDRKTVHIASKLQSFRLDYSNGGEVQHHETIKYTASLNGYDAKFTPTTRPATVDANYTFDGWYSDPECTKKFDFNTTMPATNIVVYAGWKAPEVRVTAHRSPEDMPGVNVEAAYGESVDEHLLPAISYDAETQEFLGWFTRNADGSYRPWDFSTKIYSDVDLYARVISKGTFKVSYDANGGTGTVEDSRAYAQGAKADVKAITGITAPTGKTFLYWSLNANGSGKKYYPNNTIEIEGDITLYAIWGDTTTTLLTYNGNGGATSDGKTEVVVSGLKNNQKVKAEGAIFTRTGYKFIGWSTKSDATAAEYAAGADVIVHADETVNVLYAVWEIRNDYQYTVHYYWNDTTEKVAEDKVVTNQTYNETITESPIAIEGYTSVNSGSQKMVIDAENKTLTFYYYKNVGLTANSDTKVYNGQEQSVSGFTGAPGGADFSAIHVGAKGTDAGKYPAAFAKGTIGTVDETEKYIVTRATDGKLTITASTGKVSVTIRGHKETELYNGEEHKAEGYDVDISNPLYTANDFRFRGTAEATGTNAGTYEMGLAAGQFQNTNENFANVEFTVEDGSLTVSPRSVVLTSESGSKPYDGTALTKPAVTVEEDGFVEGEVTDIKATGSVTNVSEGEVTNTITYTAGEGFRADNYSIEKNEGKLSITPITDEVVVTITGNHDSTVYDGEEHEVTGYDVAISNPLYTEGDFTFSGTAEVAGTNADTYEMGLSADDFTNTSGNFANVRFVVTDGFLKITKREVEFTANSASKAYDGKALTDDGYTLTGGSLAENQNETVTVVGSQTLVGSSDNEITEVRIVAGGAVTRALGEDVTDNYAITTIKGTLTVTDGTENDPVDPGKVVTKTHEDAAYDLGETVTFTISVTNIYDTAKTITITELPGVAIEGADASKPNVLVVTNVPAGETITATATYTITWQDIANGSFVNTVKAEFSDGKPFETTDTVTVVDPVYDYTMEKTAKVPEHESGMVKEGETIGYTIRVQNTGNQPLEEIRLTDTLNAAGTIANIRGAEYVQDGKVTIFTIRDLQPNQTITITYEYVVLDADKGKTISNAVVGPNPTDPEKPGKEGDTETTVEDPKLEVNKEVKAITAADGTEKDVTAEAALNDIITYTVTVKNTGNVVLTDVHVADSLEGIKLAAGQSFEFRKLEAGETQTITYTYQVQEKDLGSMIVNKATATAKVPEDPEDKPQPKDEDEKEVPTEDRNPSLKVEKEVTSKAAAEDGRYIAGETITYKVTVTNNGNLTLKDVVLKDVLTRADGTTVLPDGWESDGQKIGEMAPGATRVFEYSHKVTEEDLGGVLKNAATASGEPKLPNPDPEKPEPKPEGEDEKEVPTEERKPSLKAEKKVTSKPAAEDGKYTVGETITYEVTVTNTGNLTLKNIHVQDIMTRPDGTQMIPSGLTNQVQTIEGLEPNASETLRYTHVVTEQDLGGELKNAVTVSGEPSVPKPNPDPEKPEPKPEDKTEETVITEDPTNCSIIVTKKLTNMMDEALVLDNAVFYVALFTDEGLTNRIGEVKKLTFGANQSTATAVFAKIKRGIYYVAETDENGKVITSGAYNNGAFVAQYAAGQKVEIKENGIAAEFAFANQFLVLPSEYDLSKRVTIVKSVQTKKGKELKTNETFYAGIFSDAAHTQLAENVDQNIVPLATNGTAGARNEIEVTFAPGASTTLYIAEVSADGVPVEQNAAFEYTASIDQNVITLSEDTDDVTVKITNTSKKDEPETECEDNRQSESNKPKAAANSVKTGDDTPLMTFVLLLLCSASCMMLLAGRRKKEDGQDR